VPVRWQPTAQGFRFEGMRAESGSDDALPKAWLDADTTLVALAPPRNAPSRGQAVGLLLGPEPIIEPQSVTLVSRSRPDKKVRLATDGVRPFAVQATP
jgi:general secretion pathway protein H